MLQSDLSASLLDAKPEPREQKPTTRNDGFVRPAIVLFGVILMFTGAAWLAILLWCPELTALALLAYCFGCRHGIDADHIAAVRCCLIEPVFVSCCLFGATYLLELTTVVHLPSCRGDAD